MSATAIDAVDRSPYATPEADLRLERELTSDRLFSAEGRIGVWRYNARIFLGLLVIAAAAAAFGLGAYLDNDVIVMIVAVPAFIAVVGAIAMMVYASIKRIHDLNLSGWFYLIGIIPLVGIIWALYYALKPGKLEANRFGAVREATKGDKIMGVIGIALTVLMTVAAFIPYG